MIRHQIGILMRVDAACPGYSRELLALLITLLE
jgi:hypothetical protein